MQQIFNMSFLDIICCGFGAMVMLVLLSKTDVVGGAPDADTDTVQSLLGEVINQRNKKTAAAEQLDRARAQTGELENKIKQLAASGPNLGGIEQRLAEQREQAERLQNEVAALSQQAEASHTDEVVKVGGIPVDSEHIIFIVDTSGSMQQIWSRVIRELENVLSVHPQVKGFQIMNDNGVYLIKSYARKWIPDTPGRRKSVLQAMRNWTSFSNSSPVEGLERALKDYARRTDKLAIYIFGDDYTGASYDAVLNTVEKLNTDRKTGRPIAQIHGIGFQQPGQSPDRFATLMREVARRNRGAFIALGLDHRAQIAESNFRNRN